MAAISIESMQELRALVMESGFMPVAGRASFIIREFDELLRTDGRLAELSELRTEFEERGYLPKGKAIQLIDGIVSVRANR